VFALTGAWRAYLLLWFLPATTLLQAILRLRAVCEHGAVPDAAAGHPLRAARTTLNPWWLRWLLFPHDVYFHIEHHLYPSIPHYRLPACHAALAARGAFEGGAEVQTFGATLGKVFAERATGS
jgi:fatty acid desaturase